MEKEISIKKIRDDAEKLFFNGHFYCSESIVHSINQNLKLNMSDETLKMACGFPVGIGGSKCTCGAVSGGILLIGYFFGRAEKGDPKIGRTLELANELQAGFRDNHKCLCCSVLTRSYEMGSPEHIGKCTDFTGEIAESVAKIIIRELNLINIDEAS